MRKRYDDDEPAGGGSGAGAGGLDTDVHELSADEIELLCWSIRDVGQ